MEDPPSEVPKEELIKFAMLITGAMRAQALGIIEVPKLADWTREELEGTANLLLEDLREERVDALEMLQMLYEETGGEPFKDITYRIWP